MKRIALISDNHSYYGEEVTDHLADADEIWHAGDIGELSSVEKYRKKKVFRAVYGNIDDQSVKELFPLNLIFECEGLKVFMTHIGGYPGKYNARVLDIIRKDEPISRGAGSKPHIVSELLRRGGEQVYVNRKNRTMLTVAQFRNQLRAGRIKNAAEWVDQRLTTLVYVRGKVRHADHKTIDLPFWHRVAMNAEPVSNSLRFLD